MKQNLENEKHNGKNKHTCRDDYGRKFEFTVNASGFMSAEESIASAGNSAHTVIVAGALHKNYDNHSNA